MDLDMCSILLVIGLKVSKLVKESIPYETISYGPEETSQVDIYGTSLSKDSPIFVYIHGGYWQELNKDISNYPVLPLVESGIRVFVPDYSLAPEASVSDIVEQIKRLGEYVLKGAAESGSRSVWFGGHSAGAHLAASLMNEKWFKQFDRKVQKIFRGLVLISGIYDLVPIVHTYVNEPLKLDEAEAIALSPINKDLQWFNVLMLKQDFKVLLAVADNDSPSFKNQTSAYEKFLKTQNMTTELLNLKGMDHFDVVENLSEKAYPLTVSIINLMLKYK
nr:kynurenine formamidase isoform X2 [Halyomorpha halys]